MATKDRVPTTYLVVNTFNEYLLLFQSRNAIIPTYVLESIAVLIQSSPGYNAKSFDGQYHRYILYISDPHSISVYIKHCHRTIMGYQ